MHRPRLRTSRLDISHQLRRLHTVKSDLQKKKEAAKVLQKSDTPRMHAGILFRANTSLVHSLKHQLIQPRLDGMHTLRGCWQLQFCTSSQSLSDCLLACSIEITVAVLNVSRCLLSNLLGVFGVSLGSVTRNSYNSSQLRHSMVLAWGTEQFWALCWC